MQNFFRLMVQAARYLGSVVFHLSMMKLLFLIFMMTVSLSRAVEWENAYTLSAVCDNSTMHLRVNFTTTFQGAVYQSRNYFNPKCSYTVPIDTNVTELYIPMPFGSCGIKIEQMENRTMASTQISVQMHNLLDSAYDSAVNVSCEIDNLHFNNGTESDDYNPFAARGLDSTSLDFKNGLVLFGEVGDEEIESALFLVVYVRDDGSNRDMLVQNCIAHSDENLNNMTNLFQLSNFYGCPDSSAVLSNFTVVRPENSEVSMYAYAPVGNFSLVAFGRISVTCGITICEHACPAHCNDSESPVRLPLSDYATKNIIARSDGAIMPDSLRQLNRLNDRSRRTLQRSKRSFFSSSFHVESQIVIESVSEGNITNVTSTRMTKGLLVKNMVSAKNKMASADEPKNVNMTIEFELVKDEFWPTVRFVALMMTCLFIPVVACYCCYVDGSKKRQRPFVF